MQTALQAGRHGTAIFPVGLTQAGVNANACASSSRITARA